ncbi:MAG TPA: hypothetical protein VF815_01120 [Myxococcaceae bacterium]|jgi:hypothetical protein
MMTMLDRVIMRAADDENFRQALFADPDATLASEDYLLSDYECAALDEYRRVACGMTEEQELDEHRDYRPEEQDSIPLM